MERQVRQNSILDRFAIVNLILENRFLIVEKAIENLILENRFSIVEKSILEPC